MGDAWLGNGNVFHPRDAFWIGHGVRCQDIKFLSEFLHVVFSSHTQYRLSPRLSKPIMSLWWRALICIRLWGSPYHACFEFSLCSRFQRWYVIPICNSVDTDIVRNLAVRD